jgi:uncharacterized protein
MSASVDNRETELEQRLEASLRRNHVVTDILNRARLLKLPNWYLGAGCIAQTVWNELHGFPASSNIKDYDLAYFDSSDLSREAEESHATDARRLFQDLTVELDVANEARVHLWYPDHIGYAIKPYSSVEDGIASWPTTAAAIGVRKEADGRSTIYSPFGLQDLFGLIVRPNKRQITKEIYMEKVRRWAKYWPKLIIVPWD